MSGRLRRGDREEQPGKVGGTPTIQDRERVGCGGGGREGGVSGKAEGTSQAGKWELRIQVKVPQENLGDDKNKKAKS